jgi:hypothetical protein
MKKRSKIGGDGGDRLDRRSQRSLFLRNVSIQSEGLNSFLKTILLLLLLPSPPLSLPPSWRPPLSSPARYGMSCVKVQTPSTSEKDLGNKLLKDNQVKMRSCVC